MANGGRIDFTVGFKTDKSGLSQIKTELNELSKISSQDLLNMNPNLQGIKSAKAEMQKIQATVKDVQKAYNNAFNPATNITNIDKLATSLKKIGIEKIYKDFSKLGAQGVQAFNNIGKQILSTNLKFKETNNIIDKMGTTLINTLKWNISSSFINRFTGAFQQAYGYVQHLDTSLNDIRIVTGKSADEMDRFAVQANKVAQSLGKATTDYTEASLIYFQQGLGDEEAMARAETTLKAANVTGQSTAEVSEQLTAVWNGYQVSAENTEQAVDKLAAVAATTAADLEELSTGMSKVASAANSMGVDMDQLNATIATIESVTRQAPESVGTALKTIYARMGDLKLGGTDEDGLKLGDVSGTLQKVGIDVLDVNGELRDMGVVIEEIGAKWDTWTKAEQTAIAEAVAGKRQYNNLFALFDNWDMYTQALETSRNSMGTLQKQQDIYMESTAAHLQQLKTQSENLYDSLIQTSDINAVIDAIIKITEVFTDLVDSIGGGKSVLLGLGAVATNVFSKQISIQLEDMITKFKNGKENAALLSQEIARTANLKGIGQTSEAFGALKSLKQDAQQYYGVMSNEEIKNINTAIEKTVDLYAEKDKLVAQEEERLKIVRAQIEETEKYIHLLANAQTGKDGRGLPGSGGKAAQGLDIEAGVGLDAGEKTLEYANSLLKKNEEEQSIVEQGWGELQSALEEYKQKLQEYNELKKNTTEDANGNVDVSLLDDEEVDSFINIGNELDNLKTKIRDLKNDLSKLFTQSGIEDFQTDLNNLYDSFLNLADGTSKTSGGLTRNINDFGKGLPNAMKKAKEQNDKFFKAQQEGYKATHKEAEDAQRKIEGVGNAAEGSAQDIRSSFATLDLRQQIQGIMRFGSGLTSTAFAIQSIKNLGSIWNNEDITLGEKLTQTMMNLGMVIPNVVSAVKNLSSGFQAVQTVFQQMPVLFTSLTYNIASWAGAIDKAAIGNQVLLNLEDEQAAALIKTALGQEVATDALTQGKLAIIADTAAKQGNKVVTEAVTTANIKLSTVLKKVYAEILANPVGATIAALTAIIVAATIAITAHDKAAKNAAKHDLENAETYAKAARERADSAKEELNNIEQLINKYKELREEYTDPEDIDALRRKIYELSQEYSIHIDMLQLMSANYEELDVMMNNLLKEASSKDAEMTLEAINAEIDALIAKLRNSQMENSHPILDMFLKIENILPNINLQIEEMIEKLLGFEIPDWMHQISSIFLAGQGGAPLAYNEEALKKGSKNVQKVISLSSSGQLEFDEETFASYNAEQQKEVRDWLQKYYSENDSFASSYAKMLDHSAENIEKAIDSTIEDTQKVQSDIENYKTTKAEDIFTQLYGDTDIGTSYEFNDAKEQIAQRLITDLHLTEEEAYDLATKTLEKNASYDVAAAGAISDAFAYNTEKDKAKIEQQYNELNTAQQHFVSENQELLSMFPDINTFEEEFHDFIDTENRQENMLNVQLALTNADGTQLKPEDIDALFSNDDFNIGKSKDEFVNQTYQQQLADLTAYYMQANTLENDFQNNKLAHYQEEQNKRGEELQAQLENFKQQVDALGYSETTFSQDFQDWVIKEVAIDDDDIELLNQYVEGSKDLTDAELEEIEVLKESNPELFKKIEAYKQYNEIIKESPEAIQNVANKTKSYGKTIDIVTGQVTKLKEGLNEAFKSQDWSSIKKANKELQDFTNKGIDELQSSYNSLTSIMDEYNETQVISMDNLQTLLNMDTAYLAALQIEDGQMSLNEESLKQIALARLDEARAEAYAQAMEELHNEETRKGIEQSQQAVIQLSSLGGAAVNAAEAARSGIDAWREYWDAALNREGVDNDAYAQQVGDALRNKLQMIDAAEAQIMSGNFGTTMKGPSASGSDSSSEKEAEHEDYLEREADIYRTINEELEQIESTLSRIQKVESHEWGIDYQKSLEEENKLLDEQLEKLQEKKVLQEKDLSVRRKQLENVGINFSADGSSMQNAEATLDSLYASYNAMVDKYNSMTAAQQEGYKASLEVEKDRIDKIEQKIEDYESTFSEYQSTLDSLLDAHYAEIENEVNQFNNMVEVHLELTEAEREWDDFWYDIVQDMQDDDYLKQIEKSVTKLGTLIGTTLDNADSDVEVLTRHLADTVTEVQAQIASANRGGEDSLFGDDTAAAKENLEDYRDKLIKALTEAKEEIDNISENYIKMLEHAQDLIDDQVDGWEAIGDHLEHDVDLIKLISGDKAFDALNKQYEKQFKNNLNLINTQKQSQDFWAGEIDRYEQLLSVTDKSTIQWKTYSEALEKASENYKKAVQDLDKTIEEALKDLDTWRKNQSDAIMDALDKAISGGLGLELVEEEWKLINDQAGKYLDNVERAYSMEDYANILNDAATATGLTADNQARLNKFRDEELRKLNEKEKLTKYDIEESKARLAILQQQIALEDAQRNKSNMRLRRDNQGNYVYQYTADEQAVDNADQGLLTARKEWYDLVKARRIETNEWVLAAEKELQKLLAEEDEAAKAGDEVRLNKLKEMEILARQEVVNAHAEANKNIQDLYSGTAQFFAEVENAAILPQNAATISQLIESWTGKGEESFLGAVTKAVSDLGQLQEDYSTRTKQILEEAGVNYIELKEKGIDPTNDSLTSMIMTNEELSYALDDVNTQLSQEEGLLRQVEMAYRSLQSAAVSAIQSANAALNTLAATAINTAMQVRAAIAAASSAPAIVGTSSYSSKSSSSGTSKGGSGIGAKFNAKQAEKTGNTNNTRKLKTIGYGTGVVDVPTGGALVDLSKITISGTSKGGSTIGNYKKSAVDIPLDKNIYGMGAGTIADMSHSYSDDLELLRKYGLFGVYGFATGGYTGDWSGSGIDGQGGRLAILHQKELVLNESDTKNMLEAIKGLRELNFNDVAKTILQSSNVQAQVLAHVGSGILQGLANINSGNSTENYRNVTINADFSGVRSADAIYQALMELENSGMQTVYSTASNTNIAY